MNMPKRMLMLLEALDQSGVAFGALNLAIGLGRQGTKVMVLAQRGGEREQAFREAGAVVLVSSWIGTPLLGRRAFAAAQAFDPDSLHAQSIAVLRRGAALARRLGIPLLVTANRLEDGENADLRAASQAGIIAVSDAIQERLGNRGAIPRDRIRVIPNGLDLSAFPAPAFDAPPAARHVPVVGTYGTLVAQKGQRVFLAAAAAVLRRNIDAEFLILGQGPDKPLLRKMAVEQEIASRLTFSPGTTAKCQHLGSMDIFVEPSLQEGLGLSVLQAMAAGVPVIASGVGGIYSLVEDGETGVLVPGGNAEALAEAICGLLAAPERRREMSRRARERVERDFNAERVAGQVLAWCGEWASRPGGAPR